MAERRTVSVVVDVKYQQAVAAFKELATAAQSSASKAEQAFAKQKISTDQLGRVAVATSVVFTAAFVAMVKASADFEQRMSQVQALSKATASQMSRLRDAAFTAGKAFGLSATQVADAQIELTKAGVSVKDIIGGALPGALALAAAGQIDVAKATEIASNAMTEFGLAGKDVPHVADLLAAGADKSVASVESLGDALNQSGLVAAQFGLSIEDTVGVLTAFSKAGLNGSDAGTSFKTMLLSLASPSKQAQAYLDKYNITAYDSQGAFVGITNLADQLQQKLGKVSAAQRNAALSTIFGTDAIRAANVLYTDGGKKLQGFIDANNEAGFAALQASKKLDNLNGDVQKLGASFQNDLIKSGSAGNDILRNLAQGAGGLLDLFGDLPKPVQGSALAISGVGAAVTAGGAAFLLFAPKVLAAKAALTELNVTAKGTALGFAKGAGIAIGIASLTSGLAALGQQGETTEQQLSLASKSAKDGFGNIDSLFKGNSFGGAKGAAEALKRSFSGNFFENDSAGTKFIDGLTFGITKFSDTYKSNEGQFKALGEQLGALARTEYSRASSSFNDLVTKFGGGNEAARQALQAFPAYREEIVKLLNESGKAATGQNILAAATGRGGVAAAIQQAQNAANQNADALKAMSGAASNAKVDVDSLSNTIKGFGSVTLDARSAQRDFEQAVDDARKAANKAGDATKDSTEADRDKQNSLDAVASKAIAVAAAFAKQPGGVKRATDALTDGRKQFINIARDMNIGKTAAEKLADELGLIPSNVKSAVSLTGFDSAIVKAAELRDYLNQLHSKAITINVSKTGNGATFSDSRDSALSRASGGPITGPGPKGKDSVLAYLAPGEHVLTAKEVDKMGGQAAVYAFRRGIQAYATGGAIGDSTTAAKRAGDQVNAYNKQLAAAKKALSAANKTADRAEKKYDDISSGKKYAAAKKTAKTASEAAKKRADAAQDKIDSVQKKLDAAKDARDKANATTVDLRNNSEDFVSAQRRATSDNPIDPLSYVDQLRSMSRDDNFSKNRRKSYDDVANKYEKGLVDQTVKLNAATKSLDDFKSSADSLRSSVTSSIAGAYSVSGIGSSTAPTGSYMRSGISFTSYGSGSSAASIDAYFGKGASKTGTFAAQLEQLRGRGVNAALLAEIAQDSNGPQLAAALLTGTTAQISSINANYSAIQTNAATAAGTVTDANYGALIADAQKNADTITKQIASDGEKLRKLIASAFGLPGYAAGTGYASPGWHIVGERGPELAKFQAGGQVKPHQWMTAAAAQLAGGGLAPAPVVNVRISGDDSILASAMSVVADQRIAVDAHADSVRIYGGLA